MKAARAKRVKNNHDRGISAENTFTKNFLTKFFVL